MPHPKNQVTLTCEQCGKIFQIKASLANNNRRFCTWQCRVDFGNTSKEVINCENCGKQLKTYKNRPNRYCSMSCATSARNRTDANPSKHRDLSGANNPMFGNGHLTAGANNGMYGRTKEQSPAWHGGRKVRADGYIQIYAPDHPSVTANYPYVLEHRLVMEQHIERYLLPEEVVHHKDKNPSNNDISNLELFSNQSEHISKAHKEVWWYEPTYYPPSE